MEESLYSKAKILVVDDVEEVLKSTKNSLVFEGMNVECISNPVEALEYIKTNKVDVLILDYFMPEINGDVFVKKLREFNQETIIILRTGYSDQIPPLKMIDYLNIQGYIDKLKGEDELLLMTKAAIKTAYLSMQVKEKKDEIEFLNYKKKIIGDLAIQLINEAENQIFAIAGATQALNVEEMSTGLPGVISRANSNIQTLFRSLRFDSEENVKIADLITIVKELLKAKSKIDCIELKFNSDIDEVVIPGKIDVIVLALLEIYNSLKKSNNSEFRVDFVLENGKIEIMIVSNGEFSNDFLVELKNLINNDKKLKLVSDKFLKIQIDV